MKKFYRVIIFAVLIAASYSCKGGPDIVKVGYLQITPDPVLDIARQGVFQALSDSGYINGTNFKLIEKNAQGDLSMIPSILQNFITQQVDVIITNSTPCMIAAAQLVKDIPVVFTVAFGPSAVGLKSIPENLHGIYDPLDEKRYVDLMLELLPSLKSVGIPYNNAEQNSEYSSGKLGAELERRGVEVIKTSVTSSNDILMAGEYLAEKKVDAILVSADNTLYLGLNTMAKIADRAGIPLFVTDPMHTNKGAAVGYGVNYSQWGYLAGKKVVKLLKGYKFPANEKIQPIDTLDLVINREAAQRQGLSIPDSVMAKASKIL
jgi:putative ABC transport system substrate-binding protein